MKLLLPNRCACGGHGHYIIIILLYIIILCLLTVCVQLYDQMERTLDYVNFILFLIVYLKIFWKTVLTKQGY